MKRYILIFSTLLAGLTLTSCLEEYPKGQIEEDDAYTSASAIERDLVGDLYNYIGGNSPSQGLQGTIRGVYDWNTMTTDEVIVPVRGADWVDGGFWNRLYNHKWTASDDALKATWDYLYKVIALCNRSLYMIYQHRDVLTTKQYEAYSAEVRGIRAMFYFYTMDMFGNIPLVTDYKATFEEITQSKRSDVFHFIINELTEISSSLNDERSNYYGDYYGRFTLPVAHFLLAKLMLNAEVYEDDNWTNGYHPNGRSLYYDIDGQKMNAWEATIYYCDKIEASNLDFRLEDNYDENFSVHNENSKENIFVIPMDNTLYSNKFFYIFRSIHPSHARALGYGGENGPSATKSTMHAYGVYNDDPVLRYEPGIDNRFYLNFYADTVYVKSNSVGDGYGNVLVYHPLEVAEDLTGTEFERTGGARMAKYEPDFTAYEDGQLQSNDIVLFRLADVLLMRAEAKVRNGQSGQDEMNMIRNRVEMKQRDATLENILAERLLELMWEGWRRNDLIRFGQFTLHYDDRVDAVVDNEGYTTVFPIPSDVLVLNSKIVQNPGY